VCLRGLQKCLVKQKKYSHTGLFLRQPNIESFWLHANNLTGTIPSEFGLCGALAVLDISDNDLDGTLPIDLGSVTTLCTLTTSTFLVSCFVFVKTRFLTHILSCFFWGLTYQIP
jgi:hypothetical protein